jgi:hypothetical protein
MLQDLIDPWKNSSVKPFQPESTVPKSLRQPLDASVSGEPVENQLAKQQEMIEISDSLKLKSGKYPKKHIEGVIRAAQVAGIDPYQALALSLQEDSLGTLGKGRSNRRFGSAYDLSEKTEKEFMQVAQDSGVDGKYLRLAFALRDKLQAAKKSGYTDEAMQLQAYNGYGTLTSAAFGGAKKAYGIEIGSGINMKQNPVYGKRLVALKNDLQKNESIRKLIEG